MEDELQKPVSPISQLLQSIGLTREDLHRHSDQMRQFLTAENPTSSRDFSREPFDINSEFSTATSSHSLFSRSISRSHSSWDVSPPVTPVKSEPTEPTISLRNFDSMEMVIERQNRKERKAKKAKKARERRHTIHDPHHSPLLGRLSSSDAGFSLDSFMESRDVRRVSVPASSNLERSLTLKDGSGLSPITPRRGSYYRNHDGSTLHPRHDTPSPGGRPSSQCHYREQPGTVLITSPTVPVTPQHSNAYTFELLYSPHGFSSPLSSPDKPIINTVSSPGPMDPLPLEEDYGDLPYTLPPGPYLTTKPDLSYAALVGQAILSSPQHRLTLQQIYDWITIVYPHFKRGETTWMNSIRHVLSTTACFRKVVRDRSIGRTLWAIWDEDLPCFEGGGFRKNLCKDIDGKAKSGPGRKKRKLSSMEGEGSSRKASRSRKGKRAVPTPHQTYSSDTTQPFPFFPPTHCAPIFPPLRPTPHHQPYYESCFPQQIPADIIFPPLPPSASYSHSQILGTSASTYISLPQSTSNALLAEEYSALSTSPRPEELPHSSSMPELTPNRSSSLSPLLPSDALDIHHTKTTVTTSSGDNPNIGLDGVFNVSSTTKTLKPGLLLLDQPGKKTGERKTAKGKNKAKHDKRSLPLPSSPTLNCKSAAKARKSAKKPPRTTEHVENLDNLDDFTLVVRPATPSTSRPSTPQPRQRNHGSLHAKISSIRTPLSHKGLHTSPTSSLEHYKSNLDPPPSITFGGGDPAKPHGATEDRGPEEESENMRTPPKKQNTTTTATFQPITPKKLIFPGVNLNTQDSPFRASNPLLSSPWRTPGSQTIFDPHDPAMLLEEELCRLGGRKLGYESPVGLYGRNSGSLLYESPVARSPDRWTRWW